MQTLNLNNKKLPKILNEVKRIEDEERKVGRNKIIYRGYGNTDYFTRFKKIHTFGDSIKNGTIAMDVQTINHINFIQKIKEFASSTKPRSSNVRKEREGTINSSKVLLKESEMVYISF